MLPSFDELYAAHTWRPIRNCPGRYVLVTTDDLPLHELVGEAEPRELGPTHSQVEPEPQPWYRAHKVAAARDMVLVAAIVDGGVISYLRRNGSCLHTLNTVEGFARKLAQLGI